MPRLFSYARLISTVLFAFAAVQFGFAADSVPNPDSDEENPKELPFKCSAWCAFRELLSEAKDPIKFKKTDPTFRENTRPESTNWGGFGRRGQWATIVLELQNTTEKTSYKGSATIHLDPLSANENGVVPYSTTYTQDFEVGPQTEKQYTFSILCPEDQVPSAIPIDISTNGFSAHREVHLIDLADQDFVVVISESSGSFRYLAPSKSMQQQMQDDDDQKEHRRRVAVVEPAELPARWHDLMLANLVILDGPPREQLTDAQWDALKSYVKSGGHLLITAGKDPSRLKGWVEDLAGINVRNMQEISSLDEITPGYVPTRDDWRLPLVDVTVSPKGSPDVRHNKKTNFVEMATRFYAAGSVTFIPFSLSDKILMTWPGRVDIPLRILKNGSERTMYAHEDSDDQDNSATTLEARRQQMKQRIRIGDSNSIPPTSLDGFRYNLDESFAKDTPVQNQSKSTVLAFLLFYLLCAVPGNYLLFGWFRRREVAWLTVPVWATTFSFLAYGVGYMGQTGRLTVNEVSVLEAGPGQDVGIARTFLGLYAPRRDDYRIVFPRQQQAAPGHLINKATLDQRNVDMPELFLVDGDAGLSIERLHVKQRSTRRLEIVHRAKLGSGGLDVSFKSQPGTSGAFDIDVENNTGYRLYNPVLIYSHQAVPLSDNGSFLEAGASHKSSGTPAWVDPDKAFFGNLGFGTAHGTHAANRTQALMDYMRGRTDNYAGGVVCAWIDGALLPLEVGPEGERLDKPGRFEGLTLLLTPIPVRRTGASQFVGKLSIRNCSDFDVNTGTGKWQKNRNVSFETSDSTAAVYNTSTFLELQVPDNAAALHLDGNQLHLSFSVGVSPSGKAAGNQYSAELAVSVRKNAGNGRFVWTEITGNSATNINGVSLANAWPSPGFDFSLNDSLIRPNPSAIVLMVTLKNIQYFYAGGSLNPWYDRGRCPLQLNSASLRLMPRPLEKTQ